MEEQIVLLGQAFAREGGTLIPLFSCAPEDADTRQFTQRGLEAECLDLRSFRWRNLWTLRGLVHKHRIDIVHWNFFDPVANPYLWGLTALGVNVRCWYTDHISRQAPTRRGSGLVGWGKRLLLNRYSRVLCISRYVQNCLQEQGSWSNLVHSPHFINTARFCPDPATREAIRAEYGVGNRFVMVAVGHLIADKGFDVAIRAVAMLREPVTLWIIGDGPERDRLTRLTEELGVADRVRLLGLRQNVQQFLQAADAFVCPSLWQEAAGLVNLEAQACGVPVLGSNIGGIPEYLVEGESGWLFEPGNPTQLAGMLGRLMGDPELRQNMGQAARRLALERFSPESQLPRLLDLYRQQR